jgi:hypothetical protein
MIEHLKGFTIDKALAVIVVCSIDKDPLHTEPPDNPANEKAAKTLRQVERGIRQHYPGTRPAQRFLKGIDKKPEGIKTAATVNEEDDKGGDNYPVPVENARLFLDDNFCFRHFPSGVSEMS